MTHNFLVALFSGLFLGAIAMLFVVPAVWGRKWSAQRDFRRALDGAAKPFRKARFDPPENIAAFRKMLGSALTERLSDREIAAVRCVAPELAVFLEYEAGKTIGDALVQLERQLEVGRDKWWSSVERAELERERFADRIAALKSDVIDKGECPNCGAIIPLIATECPKCQAQFGSLNGWTIRPLM